MLKNSRIKIQFLVYLSITFVLWLISTDIFWALLVRLFKTEAIEESASTNLIFIGGCALLVILCAFPFVTFFIRDISKSIKQTADSMKKLSTGDYSQRMNISSASEFSEIAEAFNNMADELEQARRIKESAEKERTMLFANMAHDLKTPITSILGYSKALSDGMVSDEKKKAEYMSTITAKAMRMNELIDRLFEYVKLESPENVLHKTEVDLAELLRNSLANLYTDFEEKNISLEINIPESPVIKNVDKLEIDRVFTNLLNNAMKHNPAGITVSVSMDEKGKTVISDSGSPIPESVANQIFKPFVLGDQSRASRGGSGLGLALSYKIMKRHEGDLLYQSPCKDMTKGFVVIFK